MFVLVMMFIYLNAQLKRKQVMKQSYDCIQQNNLHLYMTTSNVQCNIKETSQVYNEKLVCKILFTEYTTI